MSYLIDQQASETLNVLICSPEQSFTPIEVRERVPIIGHQKTVLKLSREVAFELANLLLDAARGTPEVQNALQREYPGKIV